MRRPRLTPQSTNTALRWPESTALPEKRPQRFMGIVKSPSFIHNWAAPAQHGHWGSTEEEGSVPLPKDPRAEGLACLPIHLRTKCHSRPITTAKVFQRAKLLPIQPHPYLCKETGALKSLGQRGGRGDTTWDCREVLQSKDGHVPRP